MKKIIFLVAAIVILTYTGCQDTGSGSWEIGAEVYNDSSGNTHVLVFIVEGVDFVSDASVSVNGENVPFSLFAYGGTLLTPVAAGGTANIVIQGSGTSVNDTLTMPAQPIIGPNPADGASNAIPVDWTFSGSAEGITVSVSSVYTASPDGYEATFPAAGGSTTIPDGVVTSGNPTVQVRAYNSTPISGAASGSTYAVEYLSEKSFTYTP